MTRTWLDDDSWVDHAPLWLHGADRIFGELVAVLPWKQREVTMYDRRLPEPRLTAWCEHGIADHRDVCRCSTMHALPSPTTTHRPFDSVGFNLYRDGHDSVAWHSDRERFKLEDPDRCDRQHRPTPRLPRASAAAVVRRVRGSWVTATCW